MAFDSIRNKITNLVSNETLGEANVEKEHEESAPKKKSEPKVRKPREPKTLKENKPAFIRKVKESPEEEDSKRRQREERAEIYSKEREPVKKEVPAGPVKSSELNAIENVVEGYKDVLSILGIKEKMKLELKFKSSDLDYVEFTQTTPLGFDFDEVASFIGHVKYALYTYEKALAQRDKEIAIVASEVKRNEEKMLEKKHDEELARMQNGPTEEERLIEENMELKIQLNEANRKLRDFSKNAKSLEELNKENELLRSENSFLRTSVTTPTNGDRRLPDLNSDLPTLNNLPTMPNLDDDYEEDEAFENMLYKTGGLYDE